MKLDREQEPIAHCFSHCHTVFQILGSACRWISSVRDIPALGHPPPKAFREAAQSSGAKEMISQAAAEALKTDSRALPASCIRTLPPIFGTLEAALFVDVAVDVAVRSAQRVRAPPTSVEENRFAAACNGWHCGTCLRRGFRYCTLSGVAVCGGLSCVVV